MLLAVIKTQTRVTNMFACVTIEREWVLYLGAFWGTPKFSDPTLAVHISLF